MHVIILVKPISEIKEAYLQVNKFYKKKNKETYLNACFEFLFQKKIMKYKPSVWIYWNTTYNQNRCRLEM